jgi:hypothetical protein
MTRLSGDFETDLLAPDALAACADAIHGLGWRIDSVQAERIVSYAGSASNPGAARVDIVFSPSGQSTDVRIVGSDSEAHPLGADELIAQLDRARDAIQAEVEAAPGRAESESRLAKVPLFAERPRSAQIVLALVLPAVFGAIAGVVLGISAGGYWAIQLLALVGAGLGGLEHRDGREGALRGLVGGTIYGTFLLLAHAATGTDATVKLPDFAPILVVFTALFGVLGSGLGGLLRRRADQG